MRLYHGVTATFAYLSVFPVRRYCVPYAILEAMAPYIREHQTGFGVALTVEPYRLGENLNTVELILLSKNSRVMEPMMFEFFTESDRVGIRLVGDDQE